ncbi:hypothetical protein RYX36_029186 [Vicia faba]
MTVRSGHDSYLTGNIPFDIDECSSLSVILALTISLAIPAIIGKLHNLVTLSLNSNQFTGKIPDEKSNCNISLKTLRLFDNPIGGSMLNSIEKLSKLEVLIAGGNKDITEKIPEEGSNWTLFGLGDTRLSGSLLVYFDKVKRLQTLSIYTTMISNEIPKEMGSIPSEIDKLKKLE